MKKQTTFMDYSKVDDVALVEIRSHWRREARYKQTTYDAYDIHKRIDLIEEECRTRGIQ